MARFVNHFFVNIKQLWGGFIQITGWTGAVSKIHVYVHQTASNRSSRNYGVTFNREMVEVFTQAVVSDSQNLFEVGTE